MCDKNSSYIVKLDNPSCVGRLLKQRLLFSFKLTRIKHTTRCVNGIIIVRCTTWLLQNLCDLLKNARFTTGNTERLQHKQKQP